MTWVFLGAWSVPVVAAACDRIANPSCGAVTTVAVHSSDEDHGAGQFLVVSTGADPSKSARSSTLVGHVNCVWTTGMMAQRVLNEGVPYTFVGHLVPARNDLRSRVAAPYIVGPGGDRAIHVIANEVLESLERQGATAARLELHGRLLEVEGIRYFVIT